MPLVTICVPAYRPGPRLAATLQSVKDQTFHDFGCVIGFDPPAADQMRFAAPFLADPRFRCRENPERLGWDGNVAALMASVATSLFMVLPHDDLIHPAYLETLVAPMLADSSLSVAYADVWVFGSDAIPPIRAMDIPPGAARIEQVTAFFLQGAEAVPWRGVTRSSVLHNHVFPVDGYGGFAVECEWALRLLIQAPAHRVPRPLFYKRAPPGGGTGTAIKRWRDLSLEGLTAAWNAHRLRMLEMIDEISEADLAQRHLVQAAAEAALLHRFIQAVLLNWTPEQAREVMEDVIAAANSAIGGHLLAAGGGAFAAKIESRRIVANAHWAIWQSDCERGLALLAEAEARDPENTDALFARARTLVRMGRFTEALQPAMTVFSALPARQGLADLLRMISKGMAKLAAADTA